MFFSKKLNVLGVIWIVVCIGVLAFSVIGRNYLERKYDGELGINMVMIGESRVAVITLRKESAQSGFVILPGDLMVKDEKNGSAYRVGSLWGLGRLEHKGGEYTMRVLGDALGIKITAYIRVDDDWRLNGVAFGESLADLLIGTNLTLWDRYVLKGDVRAKIAKGELVEVVLPNYLMDNITELDGFSSRVIVAEKMKLYAQKQFAFSQVLAERVTMAIYNSSEVPGMATKMATSMDNTGIKVVLVGKSEEKMKGCRFKVFRNGIEKTVRLLTKTYGCVEADFQELSDKGRVDIELWIGGE